MVSAPRRIASLIPSTVSGKDHSKSSVVLGISIGVILTPLLPKENAMSAELSALSPIFIGLMIPLFNGGCLA